MQSKEGHNGYSEIRIKLFTDVHPSSCDVADMLVGGNSVTRCRGVQR